MIAAKQLVVASGSTQVYVDSDGPGGNQGFDQLVAPLDGITGLSLNDLLAYHNLIVF